MDSNANRAAASAAGPSNPLPSQQPARKYGRFHTDMNAVRDRLRAERKIFKSPISSSGSFLTHDTVSIGSANQTLELDAKFSTLSSIPDGEGTRRAESAVGFNFDTSAVGKVFPGFVASSQLGQQGATKTDTALQARTTAPKTQNKAYAPRPASHSTEILPFTPEEKENRPPTTKDTTAEDTFRPLRYLRSNRRSRMEMQAQVENASEASTVLSRTPRQPLQPSSTRKSRLSQQLEPSPRVSLQDMVAKLRSQQPASSNQPEDTSSSQPSLPQLTRLSPSNVQARASSASSPLDGKSAIVKPSNAIASARSFFFPNFRHLPDWATGTLKFSTLRNGTPMFVKVVPRSRVHAGDKPSSVNDVDIASEDEEIFVSLDKLQEEVRELHDHDAMLQHEAEKLQSEVAGLQSEIKKLRSRKGSDSAIGSESEGSFERHHREGNREIELRITELENDLEKAAREIRLNDLHNTSLVAERDEALRQASASRDVLNKMQAAAQKDAELSLQSRKERDTLRLENTSLRDAMEAVEQQHAAAGRANKSISAQQDKLRRDLAAAQQEISTVRQELMLLRNRNKALEEEKNLLAQDHASMERQNEDYFKEIKKLQGMMANRDRYITELQENVKTRNKLIENFQDLTTDSVVDRENLGLKAETNDLKRQVAAQAATIQSLRKELWTKDAKMRSLGREAVPTEEVRQMMSQNLRRVAEFHKEEYSRLVASHKTLKAQWMSDRTELDRLTQSLSEKEATKPVNHYEPNQDCVRLPDSTSQGKDGPAAQASEKPRERWEAVTKKATQLNDRIKEVVEQNPTKGAAKVTRIVEPQDEEDDFDLDEFLLSDSFAEDLTQGSNFESLVGSKIIRMKELYRNAKDTYTQDTEIGPADATQDGSEYDLPTLPGMPSTKANDNASRAKTQATTQQPKAQPVGILKKPSHTVRDDTTSRFTIQSGFTTLESVPEVEVGESPSIGPRRSRSTTETKNVPTRPLSRLSRANSDGTAHTEAEYTTTQRNMTSGFFVPDITLQGNDKASDAEQAGPSLSKNAREVLDRVCVHRSQNCTVCGKISSKTEKHVSTTTAAKKVRVMVEGAQKSTKADRTAEYEDEPTNRPSMPPGNALLVAIKIAKDDLEQLRSESRRLHKLYCSYDISQGRRERRRVIKQIDELNNKMEIKSDQVYRLHDVLEGQRQTGQAATEDFEMTILSELRGGATADSKDMSWNGFD